GLIVIVVTHAPTGVSIALRRSRIRTATGMSQRSFMGLTSSTAFQPDTCEACNAFAPLARRQQRPGNDNRVVPARCYGRRHSRPRRPVADLRGTPTSTP